MKNFIKLLFIVILTALLIAPFVAHATNTAQTPPTIDRDTAWYEDIKYLAKNYTELHRNFYFRKSEEYFISEINNLTDKISELTDTEIMLSLKLLIASMGDPHTKVGVDLGSIYPVQLKKFGANYYVIKIANGYEEYNELLFCAVAQINCVDISYIESKVKALSASGGNEYLAQGNAETYISSPDILSFFDIPIGDDGSAVFTMIGDDGYTFDVTVKPVPAPMRFIDSRKNTALFEKNAKKNYWYTKLDDNRTIYMRYSNCAEIEEEPFSEIADEILSIMDEGKIKRVILDFRDNIGGISAIISPLLKREEESPGLFDYECDYYILINGMVGSAGAWNIRTIISIADVTLIGTPTAQAGLGMFGNMRSFALPYSELICFYPASYIPDADNGWADEHPPEWRNTIFPNVYIDRTIEEYVAGDDCALDWILSKPIK